jgi:seryl-tRNA synthetase
VIDLNLIRERPEWVKAQIARLNEVAPIEEVLTLDGRRRAILQEVERLRQERNEASKAIGTLLGQLKRLAAGDDPARTAIEAQVEAAKESTRATGDRIASLDTELAHVETELRQQLLWVPNLPHESVPDGPDDSANVIHETQGARPRFDFAPKPHWDLGPALGILDFERGVKLSGSRV